MNDRDLREWFERLAGRVDAQDGSSDERHGGREMGSRRVPALIVGVAVAVAGTILALSIIRPAPHAPAAASPTTGPKYEPIVLWPDSGESAAWRADAKTVAARFAQTVLGWPDPRLTESGDPVVTFKTFNVRPSECEPGSTCLGLEVAVGPDGDRNWGVVGIAQSSLAIDASPENLIEQNGPVPIEVEVPAGREASVGISATNGCRVISTLDSHLSSTAALAVPKPSTDDPECPDVGRGYLFVYVTAKGVAPVADPLKDPVALEYPWLTVVPVYVRMEVTSSSSSSGAEI